MDDLRLCARNVTFTISGHHLLLDVSLTVCPGELVGVLGPSGSGKSTLLRALNGIIEPSKGRVTIGGIDLHKEFDRFRGKMGYVPQDDVVHRSLRVEAALRYAALLRLGPDVPGPSIDARVDRVLKRLGLDERRRLRIRRLSGGQRKRVSLGMELLTEPPILFLDEPTSGLDPALEESMMRLFRELARGGRAVLATTHVTDSIELVDLLVIVVSGRLAFFGTVAEALEHFRTTTIHEVYSILRKQPPASWAATYLRSPAARWLDPARRPAVEVSQAPLPRGAQVAPAGPAGERELSLQEELEKLKRELSQ